MKKSKSVLIALVALASASIAQAQQVTHTIGDLIVGFNATGGVGSDRTYLLSLNPSTSYRDATAPIASITNIGQDLTAVFGANWFERIDLTWGLFGVNAQSGGAVNGDPNRTVYASRARPSVATQSVAIGFGVPITGTDVSLLGALVNNAQTAFAAQNVPTAVPPNYTSPNPNGAVVLDSVANSLDEFVPPTTANSFTYISGNIMQSFAVGSFGNFGGSIGTVEGALDINRLLRSTSGANPTGTVGVGSYEGTIVIDSTGSVSYYNVPEPSSAALICLGVTSLVLARRKRQNSRN